MRIIEEDSLIIKINDVTKRLFYLLLSILISNSLFSQANRSFHVKGFTNPYYEGKTAILTLYDEKNNAISGDSTQIVNGRFGFKGKEHQKSVSYIEIHDDCYSKIITFILEKGIIKMDVDSSHN